MRIKDDHKRITIREKAIDLIVHYGFDGLSMQKLAKAANLSPSTIYVYYQNREDLLNKIYLEADELFMEEVLQNFNPGMDLKTGLKTQWQNRLAYIQKHPLHFAFTEQFRNSPLIKLQRPRNQLMNELMTAFVNNAVNNRQLQKMPADVYWSLAYGPFYTYVKLHLELGHVNEMAMTSPSLKQLFNGVIDSLMLKE